MLSEAITELLADLKGKPLAPMQGLMSSAMIHDGHVIPDLYENFLVEFQVMKFLFKKINTYNQ